MMQTVVSDRAPASPVPFPVSEAFAKDSIIEWFRGEFAAANAIIDALCGHLSQLAGGGSEYEAVFAAVHSRRLNWIPVLQMQKYHSIADVAIELKKVAARKMEYKNDNVPEKTMMGSGDGGYVAGTEVVAEGEEDSPDSDITDGGCQETQAVPENIEICSNHEECESRPARIKMTKGFIAKEPVKGHIVNVVRGLKIYDGIFTDVEMSKLNDFVNEIRIAGQNGELPGETFKIFNQQMKGNKRELIQFGVPIFRQIKDQAPNKQKNAIDPIPPVLRNVIDHLIQWRLIPNREPNSCVINFFDEGEYSQPYLKPPHVDQPITTFLLSESTMAFGCTLVSDNEGNYRAPQMLSLKGGSLLVMRGNSADMAAHAMCPSPTKRATITFFRVRPDTSQNHSLPVSPPETAMTVWQPGPPPNPYAMQNGAPNGIIRAPVIMLAPSCPMVMSPARIPPGGTGVFLPWNPNSRKHARQLPPRAQKGRFLTLPSPVEQHVAEPTPPSSVCIQ